MLQEIPLVWQQMRDRSYVGMLGSHQLAYILRHQGESQWRWIIFACNGSNHYTFQNADSLAEAQAAALACVQKWFNAAGIFRQ